jgi:hypothetical protein
MMGWYCPLEKRECDRDLQRNGPCLSCPWPSRQVRIKTTPEVDDLQTKMHEIKSKIMEMEIREHIKIDDEKFNAGYHAGLVHQAKVDREVIISLADNDDPSPRDLISIGSALAALAAVAPEDAR